MSSRDDSDAELEKLRQELISSGVEPHDLTPLPGQEERAEEALSRILRAKKLAPQSERGIRSSRRNWIKWGSCLTIAAGIVLILSLVVFGQAPQVVHASTPPLLTFPGAVEGTMPPVGRTAASKLRDLATRAAQQPQPAGGPVQHIVLNSWWATTDESVDSGVRSLVVPVERESYFDRNGTLRAIERRGAPVSQDGLIDAPHVPTGTVVSTVSFESLDPGPRYADDLPTKPTELRARLIQGQDPLVCATASGACLISDVVDLNHNYVVPPALTAALWRVLAVDASITYLGRIHDRLGRPADAFTTPGEDGRRQKLLLIDPNTGRYLGEEVILTESSPQFDFTPPAVLSFSALVEAERVARSQVPKDQ
ncbi:hypothetical protein J2X46_004083 [Nocardioides sp. BE266]|uniref:CU044_5270 family protein n=1 Tax=Nocardioides sp. BE266 TaxID=2817725 RepID=UPI0028658DBF|nr:CU044_5270 family protein [Nocardioides sp. BE266]MDR7255081.1 hypothetical protein [Nocardioides sp. BE266]